MEEEDKEETTNRKEQRKKCGKQWHKYSNNKWSMKRNA
jgi:hypothetical protein